MHRQSEVLLVLATAFVALVSPSVSGRQAAPDVVEQMRQGDLDGVRRLLARKVDVNARAADGTTALHWAAHRNDVEAVALLLRSGAAVNVANVYGVTPLSLAAENANGALVDTLLAGGADVHQALPSGETPLMTGARTGNLAVVQALLARGAKVDAQEATKGQSALMWAAAEGHDRIVSALIAAGAAADLRSTSGWSALHFAAQSGSVPAALALIAAGVPINQTTPKGETPLLIATASAHDALATFLLDRRADPNLADAGGFSPLHAAIWDQTGAAETVKKLVAAGANLEATLLAPPPLLSLYFTFTDFPSLTGATPFALAAAHANVPVMRLLVDAGANPRARTGNGSTPLLLAAGLGWIVGNGPVSDEAAAEAVRLLSEWGGDVNASNADGTTALHAAANNGADSVVQFLIGKGANVNARDKRGRSPMQIAQAAQVAASVLEFKSTVELFKKAGAQ